MGVVAGGDRGDCGVEISYDGSLQILRLEAFASPTASGRAMIAESTSHTIISAGSRQLSASSRPIYTRTGSRTPRQAAGPGF